MKKSKKVILIIISLILLIGVYAMIYFAINNKPLYEIKNYFGEIITNYETNKMAFVIEKQSNNVEIKVNGQEYKENQGFYKEGTYEIETTLNGKTKTQTIRINPI